MRRIPTRNRRRQWWQQESASSHSSSLAGRTTSTARPGKSTIEQIILFFHLHDSNNIWTNDIVLFFSTSMIPTTIEQITLFFSTSRIPTIIEKIILFNSHLHDSNLWSKAEGEKHAEEKTRPDRCAGDLENKISLK